MRHRAAHRGCGWWLIAVGAWLTASGTSAGAKAQTGAPDEAAQPKTAAPADDSGVDIVSGAGKPEPPPKREPSIVLEGGPGSQVRWNPAWQRFGVSDFIITGLGGAVAFGTLAIPPVEERWTTINSFDGGVRDALRAETVVGRDRARDASDIALLMSINQVLVDTLIVTWWGHDADTVAYEMALMNIETLAINSAINGLVAGIASRERPYREQCVGSDDEELKDCRNSKRYRSFYSGHTSTTFAIAGMTCMHHMHLPLYGGGTPDVLACASTFALAAATGTLRIVSDQHFVSDVITGAAMGTITGLTVPWLLHYRTGDLPDAPDADEVSFQIIPTPTGAQLIGAF